LTFPKKSHKLKLSRIVCGHVSMADKDTTINLLPKNSESFISQFFSWALSIGRLLIILTETVALATFIYRFSLDMQIVNLHDKIKSESFILDNFQSAETTFIDLQNRLSTVKQYTPIDTRTATIFSDILIMGKGNVTFKDITVNTQNASIEIQAPSVASLTQFVNSLKSYPLITGVSIDKVQNSATNAQVTLLITATLKQAAFAQTEQQATNSLYQPITNQP
jgi:hypothetical protein